MGFDVRRFKKTPFSARTAEVSLPDLREFFDGEPIWIVRGLEGIELGRVNEAAQRHKNIASLIESLVSADDAEKVRSIKELLGIGEEIPEETARRIEMLVIGSVEPTVDLELAVKLCKVYPIEFRILTNKIIELTGLGMVPGKSRGSGEIQPSEPR